jgi:hypothetical protein
VSKAGPTRSLKGTFPATRSPRGTEWTDEQEQEAREALRRLQSDFTYQDWLKVGAKLLFITAEVMRERHGLETWDSGDRKANIEIARRFDAWQVSVSNRKPLTKQERSALRELMFNAEIRTWYEAMPDVSRRRLNYPKAIISRWLNMLGGPSIRTTEEGKFDACLDVVLNEVRTNEERRRKAYALLMPEFADEMKTIEEEKDE